MAKWLSTLEKKLEEHSENSHPEFRVFMSAEPAPSPESHIIPQGILENSIKITSEPPTGMHANLHKALDHFTQVLPREGGKNNSPPHNQLMQTGAGRACNSEGSGVLVGLWSNADVGKMCPPDTHSGQPHSPLPDNPRGVELRTFLWQEMWGSLLQVYCYLIFQDEEGRVAVKVIDKIHWVTHRWAVFRQGDDTVNQMISLDISMNLSIKGSKNPGVKRWRYGSEM